MSGDILGSGRALGRATHLVAATSIALGALVLWLPSAGIDLWLDEVITVAIAERPLAEIIDVLKLDGSPPLYYLLAHLWQAVFGSTELAVRLLPSVIGALAVFYGVVAISRRFDATTGMVFGVLSAISPGLVFYATEARQYSLLFAIGLVTSIAMIDEIEGPARSNRVLLVLALTAACYTHNWGVFLTAGTLTAHVLCSEGPIRVRLSSLLRVAVPVGVLYAPWIAVAARQASTTGAPWLAAPTDPGHLLWTLGWLAGGAAPALFVTAVVLAGRFLVRSQRYDVLFVQAVTTAGLAWTFSVLITPAFTHRYLMITLPQILLMLAIASRHRLLNVGVAAIAVTMALYTASNLVVRADDMKSRAASVAEVVDDHRRQGASVLIIAADTSIPPLAHYLEQDLPGAIRFLSFRGVVEEPRMVDWSNVTEEMKSWRIDEDLDQAIGGVDIVIFLHELKSTSVRTTEYWVVREHALDRALTTLEMDPQLREIERWRHDEWEATEFVVTR